MINPYQTPALVHEPRSPLRRAVRDALYVLVWSGLGFAIPYLIRGGFQFASYAGLPNYEANLEAYEWLPAAIACMLVLSLSATLRRFSRFNLQVFESILIVGGAAISGLVAAGFLVETLDIGPRRLRSAPPPTGFALLFNYQFGLWLAFTAMFIAVALAIRRSSAKNKRRVGLRPTSSRH